MSRHWTPETESPDDLHYILWDGASQIALVSRDSAGGWGVFDLRGNEGAVKVGNRHANLDDAKTVALWLK